VTGEKNGFSFWGHHHYFGEVPLIFWEIKKRIFLHLEQQKFPQRQIGAQGVGSCLETKVNVKQLQYS